MYQGEIPANQYTAANILSITTNINFKATGTTALYTVPAGRSAIIMSVIVQPTASSGVSIAATGSVGTNSTTYNDIIAIGVGLGGIMTVGKVYNALTQGQTYTIVPAGTVIYGNITIAAVATGSFVCTVVLIGCLL